MTHMCIYVFVCMYIYIYIEREREIYTYALYNIWCVCVATCAHVNDHCDMYDMCGAYNYMRIVLYVCLSVSLSLSLYIYIYV